MFSQYNYFKNNTLYILLLIWLICLQVLSLAGFVSIILGYITFFVFLLFCEKNIRPFALLAFGNMVFNYVAHVYNFRGAGFVVLVPLVLVLLLFSLQYVIPLIRNIPRHIRFWAGCLVAWWFISWFFGPKTDYATLRFVNVTSQFVIGAVAIAWFLTTGISGFIKAGLLGLVAITIQTCINSQYYPLNMVTLGIWKSNLDLGIESMVGPRLLGIAIIMIFTYCLYKPKYPWVLSLLTMLAVAVPLFAGDSRQTYLGIFVGCCGFLAVSTVRRRAILLLAVVIIAIMSVFLLGAKEGYGRYDVFFNSNEDMIQKTGRGYKLQAGVDTWLKSPVWGVGMGGYSDGISNAPQGRDYPHNLILEMLAETGVIGCFLGIAFVTVCLVQIYKHPMLYLKIWNQILPVWLYAVVISMISRDIAGNVMVFYFPAGVILTGNVSLYQLSDKKLASNHL